MKPIRDIKDIENLKTDEKLIEFCLNGKVNYYRFLCFHPRNTNYVILLNHCEEPERFYVKSIIDRFYLAKDMFRPRIIDVFKSGAEWQKEKAIEALSSVLDNWVHGGDADCIIAELEEKLK